MQIPKMKNIMSEMKLPLDEIKSRLDIEKENLTATCKRMKLEHFPTPYPKKNQPWIKGLNVRLEAIKLLQENIGRTLNDINQSKLLCDSPPRVMEIKTKIRKWYVIQLTRFCTAKETKDKVKRQPSE